MRATTACSAVRRAFFWTRFETNITMALPRCGRIRRIARASRALSLAHAVVRRRVGIPAGAAARSGTGRESASGGRDDQPCATRFSSERYPRRWRSAEHAGGSRTSSIHSTALCFGVGSALKRTRTGVSGSSRRRTSRHRRRGHRERDGRGRARRVAEAQAGVLRAHQPGSRERCVRFPRFRLEANDKKGFSSSVFSFVVSFPSATRGSGRRRARPDKWTHSFLHSQSCTTSAQSRPTGTARGEA